MPAEKGNKYALGNDGGRPSAYDPKYCNEIIDYFKREPYREVEIPHYKGGEVSWVDKKMVANEVPTFHGFAEEIGVHRHTILNWCDQHKEFLDAYTYAKELQKWFLIENGLNGTYNPTAFVFTAKNVTDMKDKSDIDHTSKGEKINNIQIEIVHTENKGNKSTA